MWEIIVFSDVTTMNLVFNAIASIFQDSGYIAAGIAVSLFVVVATSLASLAAGKAELPYNRLFACIMIYFITFGQLTSVSLENRFDGTVTQIDNIPIGVAVPASLISQVGLYLAESTEAAFGMTSSINQVTKNGYLSPLSVLAAIYGETYASACASGAVAARGMGIDVCATLPHYVQECAQFKIMRDGIASEVRERDLLEALRFDSLAHSSKVITDTGNQITMTCSGAYQLLADAANNTVGTNMLATFNGATGARVGESAETRVEDAFDAIQADSGKARSYMITNMFMRGVENGTVAFLNSQGRSDIAENLNSSIEQRNYAWAMQGEMWTEIVDSFISMLEAIIYAMTPFIGLMVLTGSIGAKTVVLFFQILAVFQIIPAMLVISQNIIMNDVIAFQSDLASKYDEGSLMYAHTLMLEVKEKMGLGGMISATMIPAIAMALVTGSGMAIMGAMKGAAAQAKDLDATPEMVKQGAAIEDLSKRNLGVSDQFGNRITDSAKTEVGDIANSASVGAQVQAAEKRLNAAEKAYTVTTSDVDTAIQSRGFTTTDVRRISDNMGSTYGEIKDWQTNTLRQIQETTSFSEQDAKQVVQAASVGLTISSFGFSAKEALTEGFTEEQKDAFNKITSGTEGNSFRAGFERAKAFSTEDGSQLTTGDQFIDSQIKKMDDARSEKELVQNTYDDIKSAQSEFSLSNKDVATFAYMQGQNDDVQRRINERLDKMNEQEATFFANKLNEYDGGVNANEMDDRTARIMALMATDNAFGNQVKTLETFTGEKLDNDIRDLKSPSDDTKITIDHDEISRKEIKDPFEKTQEHDIGIDESKEKVTTAHNGNINIVQEKVSKDPVNKEIDTDKWGIEKNDVRNGSYIDTSADEFKRGIRDFSDYLSDLLPWGDDNEKNDKENNKNDPNSDIPK